LTLAQSQVTALTTDLAAKLNTNSLIRTQNQNTYGLEVIETMPRYNASATGVTLTSGQANFTFFTPITSMSIYAISMVTMTAATGGTLAKYGLYTYPNDGNFATLVAQTNSVPTMFDTPGQQNLLFLSTANGYPATYTLQAGTRYAVAVLWIGTISPTLVGYTFPSTALSELGPFMSRGRSGLSDLSPSIRPNIPVNGMTWARLENY
jgi:hypothetical protein